MQETNKYTVFNIREYLNLLRNSNLLHTLFFRQKMRSLLDTLPLQ